MAELTTLARPYAKAAFEHAQAHQQLANWSAMLGLAAAVSLDDTMQRVFKAPRLTSTEKATAFIEVCGDKFDAQAQNFIQVIAEHDRLALLPDIYAQFELYKAEQEKSIDHALAEARKRRHLPPPDEDESRMQDNSRRIGFSPAESHRIWGWWALGSGWAKTARKHALKAFAQEPLSSESAKLLFCSLRGH